MRLLAETGLIGFFLFLAFQFHVLGDVLSLFNARTLGAFAATAGVFAWLAVTFYNFTQDSLTTPNIWLVSGIMVGLSANFIAQGKPMIVLSVGMPRAGSGWHYNLIHDSDENHRLCRCARDPREVWPAKHPD
jgi:O-antigen ligase